MLLHLTIRKPPTTQAASVTPLMCWSSLQTNLDSVPKRVSQSSVRNKDVLAAIYERKATSLLSLLLVNVVAFFDVKLGVIFCIPREGNLLRKEMLSSSYYPY